MKGCQLPLVGMAVGCVGIRVCGIQIREHIDELGRDAHPEPHIKPDVRIVIARKHRRRDSHRVGDGLLRQRGRPDGAVLHLFEDFGHLAFEVQPAVQDDVRVGHAAYVALAYHKLRRTGRTMESIRGELQVTHYWPRAKVVRELRRLGCEVDNAFGEFIRHSVEDSYHIYGGRLMQTFRTRPWTRKVFTSTALLLGAEPNVYLFYRSAARSPGRNGVPHSS